MQDDCKGELQREGVLKRVSSLPKLVLSRSTLDG